MHIVHQGSDTPSADPATGPYPLGKLGVVGVIFDTKKYDKDKVSKATIAAIDKFFDNLMYEKIDVTDKKIIADEIALGELMAALNLNDRFVYHGSLTTPPCYENIFFNMLSTVYPIKSYHLEYYKKVIQARAEASANVKTTGNHRLSRAPTP
jgi:carbonic anhydrase